MEAYLQAWKLGLKAVAVYRDGCKKSQPLSRRRHQDRELHQGRRPHRRRAARRGRRHERSAARRPPQAAGRARLDHAQIQSRRPRGLHHRRPLSQRRARRTLHHHGERRLDRQRPDGQLRAGRLDRAATRRPAESCSAKSSPTPASSPAAGPATPTSATPSRSWTTSSAGSSCAS